MQINPRLEAAKMKDLAPGTAVITSIGSEQNRSSIALVSRNAHQSYLLMLEPAQGARDAAPVLVRVHDSDVVVAIMQPARFVINVNESLDTTGSYDGKFGLILISRDCEPLMVVETDERRAGFLSVNDLSFSNHESKRGTLGFGSWKLVIGDDCAETVLVSHRTML